MLNKDIPLNIQEKLDFKNIKKDDFLENKNDFKYIL